MDNDHEQNISDCLVSPEAREAATGELHELLKKVGNTNPGTSTGDDEAAKPEAPVDIYEEPEGIETEPPEEPQAHAGAVEKEHDKVRGGVLDKTMASKPSADKADKALISQNFSHGSSGDFTTHSVHLRGKSVEKVSHPRSPTLAEQVRKTTGSF